jgi:predicted metal-binding protein
MIRDIHGVVEQAFAFGFDHAALLATETLVLRSEVRDMCAAGKCGMYNKNWVCPPACGSFEEISARLAGYQKGIIVQTTAELEDEFDFEGMKEAAELQKARFTAFRKALLEAWPALVALGSGGCRLCEKCAWPDSPCRRPEEAFMSMEAAGLLVSDVCKSNGLAYYYGPKTLTYTGCFILE